MITTECFLILDSILQKWQNTVAALPMELPKVLQAVFERSLEENAVEPPGNTGGSNCLFGVVEVFTVVLKGLKVVAVFRNGFVVNWLMKLSDSESRLFQLSYLCLVQQYLKTNWVFLLFLFNVVLNAAESTTDSQPELWFEWEGDRRKWTSYTWKANTAIRDALEKGKSKTKISVGGTDFDVRLDKMVQSNCVTKWERRIRCVVSDDSGCKYFGLWLCPVACPADLNYSYTYTGCTCTVVPSLAVNFWKNSCRFVYRLHSSDSTKVQHGT